MEWMQSANAKLAKTSVSKVESDKKPSRHFIRSEPFVNEKVIYRKGLSNQANKILEVVLWVSYIFLLKTKNLKRECWV